MWRGGVCSCGEAGLETQTFIYSFTFYFFLTLVTIISLFFILNFNFLICKLRHLDTLFLGGELFKK